jgi:hypothetical protein
MDSAAIGKRRKLALFNTIRLRNGGSNESHITPSNIPAEDIEYGGSDTEDEGDEETAQFYLNKMADDTDRPQETVFGEGVEVWKSHDGTVYADFTDKVKRKIREEETWNQEAMAKVEGGLKRKVGEELVGKVENWTMQGKKKGEKMVVPANVSLIPLHPPSCPLLHQLEFLLTTSISPSPCPPPHPIPTQPHLRTLPATPKPHTSTSPALASIPSAHTTAPSSPCSNAATTTDPKWASASLLCKVCNHPLPLSRKLMG